MSLTSTLHIAILDDYQGAALQFGSWGTIPANVVLDPIAEHLHDRSALVARLLDANVIVAMRERTVIDDALLDRLPALRLIVTTGPSNAVIDVGAANDRGVTVCGTGGYVTPTSELTWGLILAAARHIPAEDAAVREGRWQHTIGTELAGRTLGLLGLGRIGSLVARVGLAFGMNVIAWSQHLDADAAHSQGVNAVALDELFASADVLSVHLVLSDRTEGLVGADEIALMKPTSILVNTSRGPIIDETALIQALRERQIACAALDVFDHEPLPPRHPLRQLSNVVLTPHVGFVTDGLYRLFYAEIVEDISAWIEGSPVRLVSPPIS